MESLGERSPWPQSVTAPGPFSPPHGAVLVAVAVSGCGGSDASDAPVEKKAFPLGGHTLTIDATNSRITLVPADVRDVQVSRQVDGWVFMGSGPDASWKMSGDTLKLEVKCKAVVSNCESRHSVKVPRGVAVKLNGNNGGVTASRFSSPLSLELNNGSITVRDSSGPLDLNTDNGSITTQRASAKSVSAHSNNGSVRLGLSAQPDKVDVETDNGGITIELPKAGSAYAVTARSHNGKVDVGVPTDKSSAHVVKARSSNGRIAVRTAN